MVDVPMPEDSDLPSDVVAKLHSLPPTLSFYAAVARFTNATRAPIEADNPLATAANPNESRTDSLA